MRRGLTLTSLLCFGLLLLTACSSDGDSVPYPNIWTEIVTLATDSQGRIHRMLTDEGHSYEVSNTLTGYRPDTTYRAMCGYYAQGESITLYQATGVHVLCDSTICATHDPMDVRAVWQSGSYINMHLAPLTQGGRHAWGYAIDSIGTGGHCYLSVHHQQGSDPLSYTQDTYASIPLQQVQGLTAGDSITLSIHTFKGIKTWNFKR